MGIFNTTRQFTLPQERLADVAGDVIEAIRAQGYDVEGKALLGGGWDISIGKGGMFKAVLGLQTALKLSLAIRGADKVMAEASVGIFGQQAVPTILVMFVAWPVVLPQIWGLIQQSRLDDTVMGLIEESIQRRCPDAAGDVEPCCPTCHAALPSGARFCTSCGGKQE